MKKFYTIIFILSMFLGFSQSRDANSVALLDKVSANYKLPLYLKFKYELKNSKENISQTENGSVYSDKEKYNLSLMNNTQIYDGKKVYNISKDDKEITISNASKSKEELLTPTKILDSYKSGYIIKANGTQTVNGRKATSIKLIPTAKSNTTSIVLALDASKKELLQLEETNAQGTVTTVTITDFKKNTIIPRSIFKVNKNYYKKKGYFITDL